MAKKKAAQASIEKRIEWHIEKWQIDKLIPYEKNPRIITDESLKVLASSFDEIGFAQPVNINLDGTILSGHARVKQLKKEGATEVDVYVPDRKLTPKQEEAVIIRMNKSVAGTWDMDKLLSEWDLDDLMDWGFTADELADAHESSEPAGSEGDLYTKKIESPIYEPKGPKPELKQLLDVTKATELINEIESSNLPEKEKEFLKFAAYRHVVFNYEAIAEYYAHSKKDTQELMENSALVIIDFQKAIEGGFVKISQELEESYLENNSDDNDVY